MYIFNFNSPLGYRELLRLKDMIDLLDSYHFKHCAFFDADSDLIEFGYNPESDLLFMIDSAGNACYVGIDGAGNDDLYDLVYCHSCGYEWFGDSIGYDNNDFVTCIDCIKILYRMNAKLTDDQLAIIGVYGDDSGVDDEL